MNELFAVIMTLCSQSPCAVYYQEDAIDILTTEYVGSEQQDWYLKIEGKEVVLHQVDSLKRFIN